MYHRDAFMLGSEVQQMQGFHSHAFLQITLNNPDLESHSATTNEIKECCRDIKVLGRKELR